MNDPDTVYRKVGRRYVPIGRCDPRTWHGYGHFLTHVAPGGMSLTRLDGEMKRQAAALRALGHEAEDVLTTGLLAASAWTTDHRHPKTLLHPSAWEMARAALEHMAKWAESKRK